MKNYKSHKIVKAAKIVAAERQEDGCWHLMLEGSVPTTTSAEETGRFHISEEDLGYMIEYQDGFVSWSPTEVFESGYTELVEKPLFSEVGLSEATGLDFSSALRLIKKGKRVARSGWNGKGMFVFLVNGSRFTVNREPLLSILGEGTVVDYHAHIDMKTATGEIVPWLASQSDVLADDWTLVN